MEFFAKITIGFLMVICVLTQISEAHFIPFGYGPRVYGGFGFGGFYRPLPPPPPPVFYPQYPPYPPYPYYG
ncbi:hypothetical protein evm_012994 [Chilo suppressalis]|nr:hypothetical protein evm_012994 [Chilo suppressalis]